MKYAESYPVVDEFFSDKGLLLYGGAGRGKTHLAVATLKVLIRKASLSFCRFPRIACRDPQQL